MPRIARVVFPGIPHHVTQRGNRNQKVFFSDEDRQEYLKLLLFHSRKANVQIWAYCLMTNHVHVIAVPKTKEALTQSFQEAHRLYTRQINFREGWRGYLWQGRYASFPMDEKYLIAAIRYVERNPVEAGLVTKAEDYPWSSAKAHVYKLKDSLLSHCFLFEKIKDWSRFLSASEELKKDEIEKSLRTGRPLGSDSFIEKLEVALHRNLKRKKPGPRKNLTKN